MPFKFLVRLVFFYLLASPTLYAQVVIDSVIPSRGATGVSPSANVVFTFSSAMDTTTTTASFFDLTGSSFATATSAWSSGDTVLTCTPSPAFTGGHNIGWFVSGDSVLGDSLFDNGSFTTASSSGTGSGTNAITLFTVGKTHTYDQTSTAAPVLDGFAPYTFVAVTSLASNRTATDVALLFPNSATSNLTHNLQKPEDFYLFASRTNLSDFNNSFPTGTYQFTVLAPSSNQTVSVNLAASLTQPNAPHISNFAAAQVVSPAQPFTLTWDAFAGGTTADFISVGVGQAFITPSLGAAGALNGTATAVQIPAGTLVANSNYDCSIGFYRSLATSNTTYATRAYLGTVTFFSLITTGSAAGSLSLTNAILTPLNFTFEVVCSPGQMIVIESSSNLLAGSWAGLLNTNASANRVRFTDPRASTNRAQFYRARLGP